MQLYTAKSARHSPFGERDEIEMLGFLDETMVGTISGNAAGVFLKKRVGIWDGVF